MGVDKVWPEVERELRCEQTMRSWRLDMAVCLALVVDHGVTVMDHVLGPGP